MRKIFVLGVILITSRACYSQQSDKTINAAEVERIERVLASDDMQGRKTFSPGIDKAAAFIADEFKKAGLQPVNGNSYFQEFFGIRKKFISASGTLNGKPVEEKNIVGLTAKENLTVDNSSTFEKIVVGPKDTLNVALTKIWNSGKNYIFFVDTAHTRIFNNYKRSRDGFPNPTNVVLVLTTETVDKYSVDFKQTITQLPLKNVVGIIPGKSKKDEIVIFSGHYDHLGIGKPNAAGDSIYNGANDDAAGTTAVIMLANHFAKEKNNERTLVFAAFTGEEVGGFGATYFSKQYEPGKVIAMFNIEMIGTESKWGTNSAYITGYERTNMGDILQKNLEGSQFKFYPDPYPTQNLFFRSDNATLARLGVPAHTISTSKMDSEKFYHTQEDEVETLDFNNMAEIIKAIAISSKSIIAGTDTPTRVDTKSLVR
ncbi:MAG TPA: M28 family peptidase [Chitinophagaceae bacterium]|nr:M28 family peptidase [Chitinophagaceae bacterium]